LNKEREFRLLNCESISEFLSMYFGLGQKEKLSIFTEEVVVPVWSVFYRARKADGFNNSSYKEPKAWGPVPKEIATQGRFNKDHESVLYVASYPDSLEREIKLKEGEAYYLAKYICKKEFSVASFLGTNNYVNSILHQIAKAVSGPEELTEKEREIIDEYFEIIKESPIDRLAKDTLSSLYMYKFIPNLYDVTNRLGELLLLKNDYGFRYSSVYDPLEYSGWPVIITLDGKENGNFVLTQKGYENIELDTVEEKRCSPHGGLESFIESFADFELAYKKGY